MKKSIVISLLLLIFYNINGQDTIVKDAKYSVYTSFSLEPIEFLGVANVNLERKLLTKRETFFNYHLHLGGGAYYWWTSNGLSATTTLKILKSPQKFENHNMEIGIGLIFFFYELDYEVEPLKKDYIYYIPEATVGYRFQKPKGGFIFRTGIGLRSGAYLSLGWAI